MIFRPSGPSKLSGSDGIRGVSGMVTGYRIVGMTYSAPARMPVGQRAVIVFSRV